MEHHSEFMQKICHPGDNGPGLSKSVGQLDEKNLPPKKTPQSTLDFHLQIAIKNLAVNCIMQHSKGKHLR
jgi:hypothetical protein